MSSDHRTIYARFEKRKEDPQVFSEFILSEDKEKVLAWPPKIATGVATEKATEDAKEKTESATVEEKAESKSTTEAKDAAPSETKEEKKSGFDELSQEFLTKINIFYRIIPVSLTVLPFFEDIEYHRSVYEYVAKNGTLIDKSAEIETYELSFDFFSQVDRAIEDVDALRAGRRALPGMFLMGLISSYDAFLSSLLRLIFITRPELLSSSERNISFKDLVVLGSVDAAKEMVIEKEIESILRSSHHAQFDWLEEKLKITLRKGLQIWPRFIEICERRNLFTHTNGVVSSQYLTVCKTHKADITNIKAGDQLSVSAEYLRLAIGTLSELGLKLIQVVWRKLLPGEINKAAISLNQVAYDLIVKQRYLLASKMLDFGLNEMKKHGDELTRKMMVINFANAKRLLKETQESEKILQKEDWTAASDLFKLCVAAVRNDAQKVISLLPAGVKAEQIGKDQLREWPVFSELREHAEFAKAFEDLFKEPFFKDKMNREKGAEEPSAGLKEVGAKTAP